MLLNSLFDHFQIAFIIFISFVMHEIKRSYFIDYNQTLICCDRCNSTACRVPPSKFFLTLDSFFHFVAVTDFITTILKFGSTNHRQLNSKLVVAETEVVCTTVMFFLRYGPKRSP